MSLISKALINKVAREWRQAAPQLSATDRPTSARRWKKTLQASAAARKWENELQGSHQKNL